MNRAADPEAAISVRRAVIDRLDDDLRAILADRRQHSRRVQDIRRGQAGPRLDPAREQALVRRWTDDLGPDAAPLAHAVLEFCRGRADPASS